MTRKNEHHWIFGNGAHIEFERGSDLVLHPATPYHAWEGTASISDHTSGELLFYTDGDKLWDANQVEIADGLGSHQIPYGPDFVTPAHAATIIPPFDISDVYHVFATTGLDDTNSLPNGLIHSSYSVSGSGLSINIQQVAQPSNVTSGKDTSERVAATSKGNCQGYWVVTQELHTQNMLVIEVSPSGPQLHSVQTFLEIEPNQMTGCMKFSPSGNLLAYVDGDVGEICVFDFDKTTGQLTYRSKIQGINDPNYSTAYGLEFSPNEQFIYYSTINNLFKGVWQVPVPSVDVFHANSVQIKDGASLSGFYAALQLGPDDKIYINRALEYGLSVINNPNLAGVACDYQDAVLDKNGDEVLFQNDQPFSLPYFTRRDVDCDQAQPPVCRKRFGICWPPSLEVAVYRMRQIRAELFRE